MGSRGIRRRVTSRLRGTDVFSRRIIISVPRSGVLIIGIALVWGIDHANLAPITSVISLATAIVAVAATVEARFQLRNFRYDLTERINQVVAAYQIPTDDLRIAHELGLLDDDEDEDDGPGIHLRLSKSH